MTDEKLAKMRASLPLALDAYLPYAARVELDEVFAELQAYRAAKFLPASVYLYASGEWPKGVVSHEDYLAAVQGLQAQVKAERDRADAADKHRIEVLRDFAATAGIDDDWAIGHLRRLVELGHKHFRYAGPTEGHQGEVVVRMFLGDVP